MSKDHSILKSFKFAINGIKKAVKNESNLKVHLIIGAFVIAGALFLNFTSIEWAILILTISGVLITEFINSTLETLVDIVSPEFQPKAGLAKDISAGCVLIASATAVIIGAILFLPKIF